MVKPSRVPHKKVHVRKSKVKTFEIKVTEYFFSAAGSLCLALLNPGKIFISFSKLILLVFHCTVPFKTTFTKQNKNTSYKRKTQRSKSADHCSNWKRSNGNLSLIINLNKSRIN